MHTFKTLLTCARRKYTRNFYFQQPLCMDLAERAAFALSVREDTGTQALVPLLPR